MSIHDPNCRFCHGAGEYETQGDMHRSAGIVPCQCATKTGRLRVTWLPRRITEQEWRRADGSVEWRVVEEVEAGE